MTGLVSLLSQIVTFGSYHVSFNEVFKRVFNMC